MKRMETKIAVTFFIMFVSGVVINGIYSVVSINSSFFTFDMLETGFMISLLYLVYIWIHTRRHQLLAHIVVVCIGLMLMFFIDDHLEVVGFFSNWKNTIRFIFCMTIYLIASHQGNKLLEENNQYKTFLKR